jgi:hypothetical protein
LHHPLNARGVYRLEVGPIHITVGNSPTRRDGERIQMCLDRIGFDRGQHRAFARRPGLARREKRRECQRRPRFDDGAWIDPVRRHRQSAVARMQTRRPRSGGRHQNPRVASLRREQSHPQRQGVPL